MSTTDKRDFYTINKICFVIDLIFVRGTAPASWTGETECPICKEKIISPQTSSPGTTKSYVIGKIKTHMKRH